MSMTREQRIHRIAELLCKMVVLAEADRAVRSLAQDDAEPTHAAMAQKASAEDDRVLAYLRVAGQASPFSIRTTLGLSRSSTYRAFARLSLSGQIVSSGHTRSVVYRLNQAAPARDKIGLN